MPLRPASLLLLVVTLAGCAPGLGRGEPALLDRLFFGRNVAGHEAVSDSAWQVFLAVEVTPRFPAGFTVLTDHGHWRGADGTIEQEAGFLLEVVHPATRAQDSLVTAIIAAYKTRFRQETVMRLTSPIHVAF